MQYNPKMFLYQVCVIHFFFAVKDMFLAREGFMRHLIMGRIEHITTAAVKATPSVPVKLTRSNKTS